eukprot:11732872-Karenia_brevis.AAC.2
MDKIWFHVRAAPSRLERPGGGAELRTLAFRQCPTPRLASLGDTSRPTRVQRQLFAEIDKNAAATQADAAVKAARASLTQTQDAKLPGSA